MILYDIILYYIILYYLILITRTYYRYVCVKLEVVTYNSPFLHNMTYLCISFYLHYYYLYSKNNVYVNY